MTAALAGGTSGSPGVTATPAALAAIGTLVGRRGPVMFFQSGGCCDGSLPMCFDDGELVIGDRDVLLGEVGGCPFYIDHRQYEAWKHTQLILGVGAGEPEGFSLPAGEDRHFIITSRVFDADEVVGPSPATCSARESVPMEPRRRP